jgi:hypothetical protein
VKRHRSETTPAAGEESCLDVVANLVGIFVILIMVLGMRTRGAWQEAHRAQAVALDAEQSATATELERRRATAQSRMEAIADTNSRTQFEQERLRTEISLRQVERDRLAILRATVEQQIKSQREGWTRDRQQAAQLKDQFDANAQELARLTLRIDQLRNDKPQPIVLEHVPTPLAQTVFGQEEHFQLLKGRLAYVPLNALLDELKQHARQRAGQLKSTDEITATLGPRDGFELRYTLARQVVEVDTRFGPQIHEMGQLAGFDLIPTSDQLGEPVATQLQDNSALHQRLSQWPASKTVITVWTYPDSYAEFRQLKTYLQSLGYLCAARPLPHGQPISGSPQGTKSAAQ